MGDDFMAKGRLGKIILCATLLFTLCMGTLAFADTSGINTETVIDLRGKSLEEVENLLQGVGIRGEWLKLILTSIEEKSKESLLDGSSLFVNIHFTHGSMTNSKDVQMGESIKFLFSGE